MLALYTVADVGFGGSRIKNARFARANFQATLIFALTTPIRDRKWRVLNSLLRSRASNRPEFVQKHL